MAYPLTHKTIIVLDRGYFSNPCGEPIEMDFLKSKAGTSAPPMRSLWTVNVESALEYYRIVRDLFPQKQERLIRFVVSDSTGRFLTESWSETEQNMDSILAAFAKTGAPETSRRTPAAEGCSILNGGLSLAIEALSQLTALQKKQKKNVDRKLKNRGRILCIAHVKTDTEVQMIVDHLSYCIQARNKSVKVNDENLAVIDEVELCLVNTFPVGTVSQQQTKIELPNTKEEQNTAGASINYDVELFHPFEAHVELDQLGYLKIDSEKYGKVATLKPEGYRTVLLRWTTPNVKAAAAEPFRLCSQAYRMTPVEVNSRPSACLSQFILAGRTVVLELPSKVTDLKPASHMLTCHGGHLYIHTLWQGRAPFDDFQTISECMGGKVNDYRVSHFVELIKECQLFPPGFSGYNAGTDNCRMLSNATEYWPLTLGESIIFNLGSKLGSMLSIMRKVSISDQEITECKASLYQINNMQVGGEQLTTSLTCPKLRGVSRKEDQYRMFWDELELYCRQFASLSANHLAVLNIVLQFASKPLETASSLATKKAEQDQNQHEEKPSKKRKALVVADSSDSSSAMRAQEINNAAASTSEECVVCSAPPSPFRPGETSAAKREKREPETKLIPSRGHIETKINLLQMWLEKYNAERWSKWRDFDGRISSTGNKAELYQDFFSRMKLKANEMQEMAGE